MCDATFCRSTILSRNKYNLLILTVCDILISRDAEERGKDKDDVSDSSQAKATFVCRRHFFTSLLSHRSRISFQSRAEHTWKERKWFWLKSMVMSKYFWKSMINWSLKENLSKEKPPKGYKVVVSKLDY